MTKQQIKQLQKLIKSPSGQQLLGDTVRLLMEHEYNEVTIERLAHRTKWAIEHLQDQYEKALRELGKEVKVKQIDLEDSIREIRKEQDVEQWKLRNENQYKCDGK